MIWERIFFFKHRDYLSQREKLRFKWNFGLFSTDMFQKAMKSHEPVYGLTNILKYFFKYSKLCGIVLRPFKLFLRMDLQ